MRRPALGSYTVFSIFFPFSQQVCIYLGPHALHPYNYKVTYDLRVEIFPYHAFTSLEMEI